MAIAVATIVRLGAAVETTGYTWDSGFYYVRGARDLSGLLAGHADPQFGETHPMYPPLGFSVAIRALHELTGLGYRDASQVLPLLAGVGLVPLCFFLGLRLAGEAGAVGAAMLTALDVDLVGHSVLANPEVPLGFVTTAAILGVLVPKSGLRPRRAVLACLALGLGTFLRSAAAASTGLLVCIVAWRVRETPGRARVVIASALVGGVVVLGAIGARQSIETKNGMLGYHQAVINVTLFNRGKFPDAYNTSPEHPGTLRLATARKELFAQLSASEALSIPLDGLRVFVANTGLLMLAAFAVVVLSSGRRREEALILLAFSCAPLVLSLAAFAPSDAMRRYAIPSRPVLVAMAAAGAVLLAQRLFRLKRGGGLTWGAAAASLILGLALLQPTLPWNLDRVRARFDASALAVAELIPRGARVARGPGGETAAITLGGGYPVYLASGPTPQAVETYVRRNRLEWIVYAESQERMVNSLLPGRVIVPRLVLPSRGGGEQILAQLTR